MNEQFAKRLDRMKSELRQLVMVWDEVRSPHRSAVCLLTAIQCMENDKLTFGLKAIVDAWENK